MEARTTAAVLAALTMLVAMAVVPVQVGAGGYQGALVTNDCVAVNLKPPGVDVGQCGSWMEGFETDAFLTGTDVEVQWTYPGNRTNVTAFYVFRGLDPANVEMVDRLDPLSERYLDTAALESGQSIWYRVVATYENGTMTMTPAALVAPSVGR